MHALKVLALAVLFHAPLPAQQAPGGRTGTPLDPAQIGPGWIEDMAAVESRTELALEFPSKVRGDAQGHWEVPSPRWTGTPHSGQKYAAVKWGDSRVGIGFGQPVEFAGLWVGGHLDPGSWAGGVRVVGYLDGRVVASSPWLAGLDAEPAWLACDFERVDRVLLEAAPTVSGAGFFAVDDLTYAVGGERVVVDFEDAAWKSRLSGSDYAGLVWETGSGDFSLIPQTVAPPPMTARRAVTSDPDPLAYGPLPSSAAGTPPTLVRTFDGPVLSDPGAGLVPDTMGAVGTTQFVVPLNFHLSIYDKATEARLSSTTLNAFFNTTETTGDPRVVFDHHENRWIVLASDWTTKLWFAYSLTDDAMGAWFKTTVNVSVGPNAGAWPDYPTLGVDANGIYTAALMVGGAFDMTIFAFDKAPLLTATPAVTGTYFANLPYEEAIQPCVTFGNPGGQYFVSRAGPSAARLRRVDPPLTSATLVEVGLAAIPTVAAAPAAPSLNPSGTAIAIDTHSERPMNAIYRDGSVWTAHAVGRNGRSAVGWYEFDAATATLAQQGWVEDPVLSFYVPTLAVNAAGDLLLGFSGSSAQDYVGSWYAGRAATDPAGETAAALPLQPGAGPFAPFGGTQRWGDYTMTSVDPTDDATLWTIQQVAAAPQNTWTMHIGEFRYDAPPSFTSYCTAGTSAAGCTAQLSATGAPSASAPSGFTLQASGVEGQKDGLFFFGTSGRQANPWGSGTSYQCVVPPVVRAGLLTGAGTLGQCDGAFAQDLNALWTAKPNKNPGAGALVQAQLWYRDPQNTSNQTTSLSDALEFAVNP